MIAQLTECLNSLVTATYAVNDQMKRPFEPLEEIIYKPVYAFMEMTELSETTSTLFMTF